MIDMAFPAHWNGMFPPQVSMTLRDYFAAKAMHALLTRELTLFYDPTSCAGAAYDMADAMLKARKK